MPCKYSYANDDKICTVVLHFHLIDLDRHIQEYISTCTTFSHAHHLLAPQNTLLECLEISWYHHALYTSLARSKVTVLFLCRVAPLIQGQLQGQVYVDH